MTPGAKFSSKTSPRSTIRNNSARPRSDDGRFEIVWKTASTTDEAEAEIAAAIGEPDKTGTDWFPGTEGTHFAGVPLPETEIAVAAPAAHEPALSELAPITAQPEPENNLDPVWTRPRGQLALGLDGEEERQSEHDNPGQQTQGQAESKTPAPASAGDRQTGRVAWHLVLRQSRGGSALSRQNRILTIDTGTVYRAPGQAGPGNDINAGSLGSQKAPT